MRKTGYWIQKFAFLVFYRGNVDSEFWNGIRHLTLILSQIEAERKAAHHVRAARFLFFNLLDTELSLRQRVRELTASFPLPY